MKKARRVRRSARPRRRHTCGACRRAGGTPLRVSWRARSGPPRLLSWRSVSRSGSGWCAQCTPFIVESERERARARKRHAHKQTDRQIDRQGCSFLLPSRPQARDQPPNSPPSKKRTPARSDGGPPPPPRPPRRPTGRGGCGDSTRRRSDSVARPSRHHSISTTLVGPPTLATIAAIAFAVSSSRSVVAGTAPDAAARGVPPSLPSSRFSQSKHLHFSAQWIPALKHSQYLCHVPPRAGDSARAQGGGESRTRDGTQDIQ